jgi:hypothetical protein
MIGFKSHIKRILCYPFKLKYLNQKVFYPILKKHNFFLENIEYIYWWVSNSTFEREKKTQGLARVSPWSRLTRQIDWVWPGQCTGWSFNKLGPVQPPGQLGPRSTCRAGPGLITIVKRIAKMKKLNFYLLF